MTEGLKPSTFTLGVVVTFQRAASASSTCVELSEASDSFQSRGLLFLLLVVRRSGGVFVFVKGEFRCFPNIHLLNKENT